MRYENYKLNKNQIIMFVILFLCLTFNVVNYIYRGEIDTILVLIVIFNSIITISIF